MTSLREDKSSTCDFADEDAATVLADSDPGAGSERETLADAFEVDDADVEEAAMATFSGP